MYISTYALKARIVKLQYVQKFHAKTVEFVETDGTLPPLHTVLMLLLQLPMCKWIHREIM